MDICGGPANPHCRSDDPTAGNIIWLDNPFGYMWKRVTAWAAGEVGDYPGMVWVDYGFVLWNPDDVGGTGNSPYSRMTKKQLDALKGCVKNLYNVDLRNFTPVAAGSNGYFYGLNGNGGDITVETNVTHSSWTLGVMCNAPL